MLGPGLAALEAHVALSWRILGRNDLLKEGASQSWRDQPVQVRPR
jgi:hypothetical protein